MLINFTRINNSIDISVFKTLYPWRIQFLIIFLLFSLLILFYYGKQYIKKLSINKDLQQTLDDKHQQRFKKITDDKISKIPLQTSKRKILTSKSIKTNNKKSSTLLIPKPNKSHKIIKSDQTVHSSSTIKISLVISKENNNHKDDKYIDQTLSNISLLTIHEMEKLKSKQKSHSISIEQPSINLTYDISNNIENISLTNDKSNQHIATDFKQDLSIIPSTLSDACYTNENSTKSLQIQDEYNNSNRNSDF